MTQNLGAFTPIKFALQLVKTLYNKTIYRMVTNTKYEGQIKKSGDTVTVRTAAKITLSAYTKGMTLVAQDLNPTSETLDIDQQYYFKFVVDDIDEAQNDIDAEADLYQPISYGRIARTDTIHGIPRYLSAGDHTVTLLATDKNASSLGYDIWADQLLVTPFENYPPSFTWSSVLLADTAWGSYFLSWDAEDPDDDATIELYAYRSGLDTIDINDQTLSEDNDNSYTWDVTEVEHGWYHVYSVIDDGLTSVTTVAPGSLYVVDSNLLPINYLVISIVPGTSDLLLSWENIGSPFYIVYRSPDIDLVHQSASILDTTIETSYTIEDELINGGEMNFYTVYALFGESGPELKTLHKEREESFDIQERTKARISQTKKETE